MALLAALWAGLIRLGWNFPPLIQTLPGAHGPLMVSGFVGTLVGLERAVALGKRWAFTAPLFSGLGAWLLLLNLPLPLGKLFIVMGSLGLVAVYVWIVRQQSALFNFTMLLGALMWFVGNLLFGAGWSIFQLVLWWAGFLVLTIAGERLELGRIRRYPRSAEAVFLSLNALLALGLCISPFQSNLGVRLCGLAFLGLAVWLLSYDVSRRTVRQSGLTRFIALSLLIGFFWLGVGGVFALVFDRPFESGLQYDALLHSLFLGFILSMIFGHAPIILPAVLGRPISYSASFYLHLLLLHLSLVQRIGADLLNLQGAREWGGIVNVIAVLLFLGNTARSITGSRAKPVIGRAGTFPRAQAP